MITYETSYPTEKNSIEKMDNNNKNKSYQKEYLSAGTGIGFMAFESYGNVGGINPIDGPGNNHGCCEFNDNTRNFCLCGFMFCFICDYFNNTDNSGGCCTGLDSSCCEGLSSGICSCCAGCFDCGNCNGCGCDCGGCDCGTCNC